MEILSASIWETDNNGYYSAMKKLLFLPQHLKYAGYNDLSIFKPQQDTAKICIKQNLTQQDKALQYYLTNKYGRMKNGSQTGMRIQVRIAY